MDNESMIVLKQVPVISHKLKEIGLSVETRLSELNLKNLVATAETIKSMKELRATLNKEFEKYETQRKLINSKIDEPKKAFGEIYKEEITERYESAVSTLKGKIQSFEMIVKDEKKAKIEEYFNELCLAEKVDFVKFEQLGLEINLSTSLKKYKEICNDYITKVVEELGLIDSNEFKVEILVEYKRTLNVAKSIQDVQTRKENERKEAERIKQKEYISRKATLTGLGLQLDPDTQTYFLNDEIYVSWESVKDENKERFDSIVIELDEKIKDFIAYEKERLKPTESKQEREDSTGLFAAKQKMSNIKAGSTKPEPVKEVLQAPVEESKPLEELKVSFEVVGTLPELKALKQYIIDQKLNYKTIQ